VGLADFAEKELVVLIAMGTSCPIGNLYLPDLIAAQKQFDGKLQIIGINSNSGDTPEKIAAHAREFELNFPVLCDSRQAVADLLGTERTAEVFLLDRQRVIRYHGRIDDRYDYTTKRQEAERSDLKEAVQELLAGKEVSIPETKTTGCLISRPRRRTSAGEVTYAKQVSRIIQNKCQTCHHPGTAAPFSLLTYDDAVQWSAMMKEVVLERRMPPWHADPRHGHFSNDRRLAQDEIEALVAWIDNGTPEGDAKELPPAREYPDGWRIGKPDVVFELPEEVVIPATGVVPYQYFATKTNFEEDTWIQAAEARPGNRGAVHHIVVFYREPNEKKGGAERNWVVGAAIGDSPLVFPEGIGRRIPKGSTLIWQMHYTPTGKEERDRSQIAFQFCKTPPRHNALTHGISNHRLQIPPGDPRHAVQSSLTVPKDVQLLSLMPHMHLRGKDFEYRAVYPDGRKEVLLTVPQFDFNWQSSYFLAEPLRLPQGTKIECVAHYDNSPGNRANPDPTKTVRWGDQTWEEMMIGYIDYIIAEDQPAPKE
jgi:peroxiredoxin